MDVLLPGSDIQKLAVIKKNKITHMKYFDEKLVSEIVDLVKNRNIREALTILVSFYKQNETIYYRDIIKLKATFEYYQREVAQGITLEHENRDLDEYFKENILEIVENLKKEQPKLLEENLRFIKKELERITNLIARAETEDVIIAGYTQLFSRIHSKYYKHFLRTISEEFNPSQRSFDKHRNLKNKNLIDLIDLIRFEKELIHKEILREEILKNKRIIKIISLLEHGKIKEALLFLESISIEFLQLMKNNVILEFRIPIQITWDFLDREKETMRNWTFETKERFVHTSEVIEKLLWFIEFCFNKKIEFFFGDIKDFKAQKSSKNILNKETESKILEFIKKAELEKALEVLLDELPEEENEYRNEIYQQISMMSKNNKNKRLGLEYDKQMENKIANSILQILNQLKNDR